MSKVFWKALTHEFTAGGNEPNIYLKSGRGENLVINANVIITGTLSGGGGGSGNVDLGNCSSNTILRGSNVNIGCSTTSQIAIGDINNTNVDISGIDVDITGSSMNIGKDASYMYIGGQDTATTMTINSESLGIYSSVATFIGTAETANLYLAGNNLFANSFNGINIGANSQTVQIGDPSILISQNCNTYLDGKNVYVGTRPFSTTYIGGLDLVSTTLNSTTIQSIGAITIFSNNATSGLINLYSKNTVHISGETNTNIGYLSTSNVNMTGANLEATLFTNINLGSLTTNVDIRGSNLSIQPLTQLNIGYHSANLYQVGNPITLYCNNATSGLINLYSKKSIIITSEDYLGLNGINLYVNAENTQFTSNTFDLYSNGNIKFSGQGASSNIEMNAYNTATLYGRANVIIETVLGEITLKGETGVMGNLNVSGSISGYMDFITSTSNLSIYAPNNIVLKSANVNTATYGSLSYSQQNTTVINKISTSNVAYSNLKTVSQSEFDKNVVVMSGVLTNYANTNNLILSYVDPTDGGRLFVDGASSYYSNTIIGHYIHANNAMDTYMANSSAYIHRVRSSNYNTFVGGTNTLITSSYGNGLRFRSFVNNTGYMYLTTDQGYLLYSGDSGVNWSLAIRPRDGAQLQDLAYEKTTGKLYAIYGVSSAPNLNVNLVYSTTNLQGASWSLETGMTPTANRFSTGYYSDVCKKTFFASQDASTSTKIYYGNTGAYYTATTTNASSIRWFQDVPEYGVCLTELDGKIWNTTDGLVWTESGAYEISNEMRYIPQWNKLYAGGNELSVVAQMNLNSAVNNIYFGDTVSNIYVKGQNFNSTAINTIFNGTVYANTITSAGNLMTLGTIGKTINVFSNTVFKRASNFEADINFVGGANVASNINFNGTVSMGGTDMIAFKEFSRANNLPVVANTQKRVDWTVERVNNDPSNIIQRDASNNIKLTKAGVYSITSMCGGIGTDSYTHMILYDSGGNWRRSVLTKFPLDYTMAHYVGHFTENSYIDFNVSFTASGDVLFNNSLTGTYGYCAVKLLYLT